MFNFRLRKIGAAEQQLTATGGVPAKIPVHAAPAREPGICSLRPGTAVPLTLDSLANWKHDFQRFVRLDPQIELVRAILEAAITTGFEDRPHALLHGPPGCGKTEVLRTLAGLLGQRHCRYLDAASISKAGAEEFLLGAERVPSVLVLDEIDKAGADTATAWLQVLDDRSEVSKTDGRSGHRRKSIRLLVFAAANQPEILLRRQGGALLSRLAQRIFFPPPSAADVEAILLNAADASGIRRECVARVLSFASEEGSIADPRRTLALLRSGRDRWLGEEYPRHLLTVHGQKLNYELHRQRTAKQDTPAD